MATKTKSKPKKPKSKPKSKSVHALTARWADKHILYQLSVQDPEFDSKFLRKRYKKATGRRLRVFREDFCGTALLSSHMVARHDDVEAVGVDLDKKTLDWGRRHNAAKLSDSQRERLTLIEGNVLDVTAPADLIAALNFSFNCFHTRADLGAYMANAHQSLNPGGLLVLDVWGGSESQEERDEYRAVDGFTYVWDLAKFDPVSYRATAKIHFEFDDGSRMRNAFIYKWRLWTLPELRELMIQAGFENIHVYWEGTDKSGGGNGVFRKVDRGEADQSWIAYIVGQKPERETAPTT